MLVKRGLAVVVLVLAIGSVVVLAVVGPTVDDRREAVAVVHLAGPVNETAAPLAGPAITPSMVRDRLEAAEETARVGAVVLRVDTPGGAVAASQEIADLIDEFPLPVVVSMGDQAASAGYYISAGADRIVAQPGTFTGSIGAIWPVIDPDELLDRLGVDIEAVTAGEHKDMFLPGEMTAERRAIVQQLMDDAYEQFVTHVAQGRGLEPDQVTELATGEIYIGERALELGLVDELGGVSTAVAAAEELAGITDADVVEVRPTLLDQLTGGGAWRLSGLLPGGAADDVRVLRELLYDQTVPRYGR